jgi:hypothetical protein
MPASSSCIPQKTCKFRPLRTGFTVYALGENTPILRVTQMMDDGLAMVGLGSCESLMREYSVSTLVARWLAQ